MSERRLWVSITFTASSEWRGRRRIPMLRSFRGQGEEPAMETLDRPPSPPRRLRLSRETIAMLGSEGDANEAADPPTQGTACATSHHPWCETAFPMLCGG